MFTKTLVALVVVLLGACLVAIWGFLTLNQDVFSAGLIAAVAALIGVGALAVAGSIRKARQVSTVEEAPLRASDGEVKLKRSYGVFIASQMRKWYRNVLVFGLLLVAPCAFYPPALLAPGLCFITVLLAKIYPRLHPIILQLERYGNPFEMAADIDRELQGKGPDLRLTTRWMFRKNLYVTPSWFLCESFLALEIVYLRNVLSVDYKESRWDLTATVTVHVRDKNNWRFIIRMTGHFEDMAILYQNMAILYQKMKVADATCFFSGGKK